MKVIEYTEDWRGCYRGGWEGMIVPEAFAHPAKFAFGLIERIYDEGLLRGWFRAGDLVGDCFAGIGCGGIVAAYKGLRWVGSELEERFCRMAGENFVLHRKKWAVLGVVEPVCICGDSRRFAELVGECAAVVGSPPFVDSMSDKPSSQILAGSGKRMGSSCKGDNYGQSPGQIGRLKPGSVDAVVSSPPYGESIKGDHGETETAQDSRDKRNTEGGSLGQSQRHGGYGASPGNLGRLKPGSVDAVCTSPPYAEEIVHGRPSKMTEGLFAGRTASTGLGDYGRTPGQIGRLKPGSVDAVCTSPPYAEGLGHGGNPTGGSDGQPDKVLDAMQEGYGGSNGSIGNTTSDTYWSACAAVYDQCRQALKPGGYMILVCKDYIADKARVPLCADTIRLCEGVGFTCTDRIRCWLVEETRHPGLFGEDVVERKKRVSFFRRLYESKYPHNAIDWEEVLVFRSPDGPCRES